ncbi:SGNH/GDSL hydrolase family protein [Arthrobacter sp. Br18]|uniref:SGNH/GDSL hydrolase family protein n=1 Tax=Arthrobacter sp. Br18 TaxID=1312954 RepID=UPI0004B974CE|nr:SGNH/GDSL hydrolase family protein [Arthrobacter sp. Br18]
MGSFAAPLPSAVLLTGDSITEGWHATTEGSSFRGLVEEWLTEGGAESVFGTYQAGYTVQEVAEGFEIPRGMDLAVVELGTNDIGRNNAVDGFGVQYAAYLEDLEEASPGVRLVCLGVWHPASDKTSAFDAVIESECTTRGGVFHRLSGLFGDAGLRGPEGVPTWVGDSDVFHPNDAGHERIAELVKQLVSAP